MHSLFLVFYVNLIFLFHFTLPSLSIPFLPTNNVTLYGDAHFTNNAISLTQEHFISSSSGIGRALYVHPIRFLDPKTNATASFSCRFSFTITPSPFYPFGDGLAFLITSTAHSFSSSNGYIGLPQDSFIAVEFDTTFDPSLGDMNDNHIGIDVNTVVSFASVDAMSNGIDLRSGRKITAWIEYRDSVKLMRVWVGYSQTVRPQSPLLVTQIDLSNHFKEYMHVGFSASNGQGSAAHIVDRWRFKTYRSIPSLTSIDSVEEGDCVMCSPEETYIDSSPVDHKKRRDKALGLGSLAAFVICIVAGLAIISFFVIRRKWRLHKRINEAQSCRAQMNRVPTRLSLAEIRSATMGFHQNKIVGEGASAKVYKGSLPSGGAVAVKRFERDNRISCTRNPFTNEFATMVGCLRHKNLVQLQGWCCEETELVLVYEYLPNGSLDKILHNNSDSAIFLSWELRLNIVLGVASALSYLHEECERQIIHRDVKACNIMLDAEFNAKLGDFGLAEVYEHSSNTREATIPAGTMGYLAPEYVYTGVPTEKTDVYSFGVVMLEVASGRRPVDDDGTVLVDWVWGLWKKGKLLGAVDSKLMGKFNVVEMERMLMVGLSCVHPNHKNRPTVKEAVRSLRGEAKLPLLPVRKPTVGIRSVLPEDSEEELNFGGDHSPGFDDTPWLTPRSHFSLGQHT